MIKLGGLSLVVFVAAACGGGAAPVVPPLAAPTAPSPPPLPAAPKAVLFMGRGSVQPQFAVNFAQMLFDASHSYGEELTYVLEFGDGDSSTEPVVMHRLTYAAPPPENPYWRRTARLTVTDRYGRSDSTEQQYLLVSIGNAFFTGWDNRLGEVTRRSNGIRRHLTFTQNGTALSGWYEGPTDKRPVPPRRVSGALTDDGGIRVRTENGAIEISGEVAWGTGDNANEIVLRLSIKDEMAAGAVLDFYYDYPPY